MSDGPFVRVGDPTPASSSEYHEILSEYESFGGKGPPSRGYRLTILPRSLSIRIDEVVTIVHICESLLEVASLYVMGPKPVFGEYVDDVLATEAPPPSEDPLIPSSYDGRVLPGPGIDTNYDVTEYRFTAPGRHSVQWRLGPHVSNTLWFTVGSTPFAGQPDYDA